MPRPPASTYDSPGAVGLLTSTSASRFRAPIDENLLRIVRAPKSVRVLVVISNLEFAIMAVLRIPPLISGVRPSGVESIGIRLLCVASILAIEMTGQRRTDRTPDNDACNCRTGALASPTKSTAQQAANSPSANTHLRATT